MDPGLLQSKGPAPPGALLPSGAVRTGFQGVIQGGLGTLYFYLLSLRVGLLGWYFCFKQMQWDFLRWVHASMELVTDLLFCWAQNVLLAWMMLLVLAWKIRDGIRWPRRRPLATHLTWGLSVMRSSGRTVRRFLGWVAWMPACGFAWMICCIARTLEISYEKAAKIAKEIEEEEEEEEKELLTTPSHLALQQRP